MKIAISKVITYISFCLLAFCGAYLVVGDINRNNHTQRIVMQGLNIISSDGKDIADLRGDQDADMYCPSWDPNHNRVAYAPSFGWDVDLNGGLSIADVDTRKISRITDGYDTTPAWSPNGKMIAFARMSGEHQADLFTIDIHTRHVMRLTSLKGFAWMPSWSPDGSKIIFTYGEEAYGKLYLYNFDTGKVTVVPHQPYGNNGYADWSVNGEILFCSCKDDLLSAFPAQLYVMQDKQWHYKRLAINKVVPNHVAWSPNGKQIVFTKAVTRRSVALFIADKNGRNERQIDPLKEGGKTQSWPDW